MKFLYRLTHMVIIWVFPVFLVLTSLVVMLPQTDQHKSAIAYNNFYPELSSILMTPPEQDSVRTETVILRSLFDDLATAEWLQGVVETNIDNFINWLISEEDEWIVYIPTSEVQTNIAQNIDNEVEKIIDSKEGDVQSCGSEDAQQIRREGFNLDEDFCLPASVISGEESLTEFMGIGAEELEEQFLSSFLQDSPITSDNISVNDLVPDTTPNDSLETVRSGYSYLRDNLIVFWIVFGAFLVGHLLIAKAADRTFVAQVQKILLLTGINTLILSAVIIMIIAGGNYFSSSIVRFTFPGLELNTIQNMLLLRAVLLIAGLLQVAIITGITFIVARIVIAILRHTGMIGSVHEKNKRLSDSSLNIKKNPTHDGEFRRQIHEKRKQRESVKLAGLTSLNHDLDQTPDGYGDQKSMPRVKVAMPQESKQEEVEYNYDSSLDQDFMNEADDTESDAKTTFLRPDHKPDPLPPEPTLDLNKKPEPMPKPMDNSSANVSDTAPVSNEDMKASTQPTESTPTPPAKEAPAQPQKPKPSKRVHGL